MVDGGWGGFLVITVSHPTFCCVGVGLWLRWGWAVTKIAGHFQSCMAKSYPHAYPGVTA